MVGLTLYLLPMGFQPFLPSLAIPRLPSLPGHPTPENEEAYLTEVSCLVINL